MALAPEATTNCFRPCDPRQKHLMVTTGGAPALFSSRAPPRVISITPSATTIAEETLCMIGKALARRPGRPVAAAGPDGPAPLVAKEAVVAELFGLPCEAKEGRLPPAPSCKDAPAILRAEEEGGASGRAMPAVRPAGGVAGGRRGREVVPVRIASRLAPLAGEVGGPTADAARALVAAQGQVERLPRREAARPAAVGAQGAPARHLAEGRDQPLPRAVEEVPVTARVTTPAAAIVVPPPGSRACLP